MRKLPPQLLTLVLTSLLTLTLSACSPQYNWRDYRSDDALYAALFPGKPATQTRGIKLDRLEVSMTMTATDIDGVVFAIGSAQLADAAQAPAAIEAMKTAMVNNIGGVMTGSKPAANGAQEIEASGQGRRLHARFLSKDRRIYQVVVIGSPQKIDPETVDTFFTSFKLD